MFMRVNSKCAHQVRPPVGDGADQRDSHREGGGPWGGQSAISLDIVFRFGKTSTESDQAQRGLSEVDVACRNVTASAVLYDFR